MCWKGRFWKSPFLLYFQFCFEYEQDQVRMVQHKQTRELYALKYINKPKCVKMRAVANIIQERRLLEEVSLPLTSQPESSTHFHPPRQIDHPFVVNLRYAFQDDENCFFVLDLMLGGDLRCMSIPLFSRTFRSCH